ncbi:unnamed protein product, partial [marine sediment metagenome]
MRKRPRKNAEPDIVPASSSLGKEAIAKTIQEMKDGGELPDTHIAEDREALTMVRVTPICMGVPFDEVVFSKWAKHMLASVRPMPWDDVITTGSTYLPDARNLVHDQFLERSKSEFLWMLDSDVIPPPGIVDALLTHTKRKDVRIVGGWYRIKQEPYLPVVYEDDGFDDRGIAQYRQYGNNEVGKGLERVDAAGAGCWMLHRSVAEAIG